MGMLGQTEMDPHPPGTHAAFKAVVYLSISSGESAGLYPSECLI